MASDIRSDWQEQLMALRGLTALTGALHEAQVLNLRQWGAIAFPHVPPGQWEILVQPETRTVTYALHSKKSQKAPSNLANLVAALDRSIHWLLGDEWAVHITDNGKDLYQGQRQIHEAKTQKERRKRVSIDE